MQMSYVLYLTLNIGNKLWQCVEADINMAICGSRYQYGNNYVVDNTNVAVCGSRYLVKEFIDVVAVRTAAGQHK